MVPLLPPQRLASITSMEINWYCDAVNQPHASNEAKAQYDKKWADIASMSGLRKLRVAVHTTLTIPYTVPLPGQRYGSLTPVQDAAWLSPLDQLSKLQLETFDFAVPTPYYVSFQQSRQGAPYRLLEGPSDGMMEYPLYVYIPKGNLRP